MMTNQEVVAHLRRMAYNASAETMDRFETQVETLLLDAPASDRKLLIEMLRLMRLDRYGPLAPLSDLPG